jgi:pimeloyl-ACP methyl ester carboxylesterase
VNPWIIRIGVTALVLGGGFAAHAYLRFSSWRREMTAGLSEDSQVAVTSRGAIEYLTVGAGVPVLWLHGNPGGYDQLSRAFLVRPAFSDGLRSIVVSRPGYLRTPLASGATPEAQAHLFAALLDSLHIDRVAVVGVSGGGPSALQFARLYPTRTRSLALVFAITKLGPPEPIGRLGRLVAALGADDLVVWRALRASARARPMSPPDTAYDRSARALAASVLPRSARRAGDENDRFQFERSAGWPIDGISAPTLVIAGTRDLSVPFDHAQLAMDRIPGARLVRIEGGHGATLTRANEVWPAVRAFVLEHAAR